MAKVIVNEQNLSNIGAAIRAKLQTGSTYKPSQMASAIMSIRRGVETDDATLSSGNQMLNGVTAYANSSKYTGTIQTYTGSVNGSQGSIPTYEIYSGSYSIMPSTVSQAFPTAGKVLTQDFVIGSYESSASLSDIIITENGSYSASSGYDGFGNVVVNVPQGGTEAVLSEITLLSNGVHYASDNNVDGFSKVTVSIPTISLSSASISANGTYTAESNTGFSQVVVSVPQGITPTGNISISENGTYDVSAYASAIVDISNTYSEADNGKVVSGSSLVAQGQLSVSLNSTYDTTFYSEVVVDLPSIPAPVLSSVTLLSNGVHHPSDYDADGFADVTVSVPMPTGSVSISENGSYDVGAFASAIVSVANTYSAGDNGKVVLNGELIAQGSLSILANNTYDTTSYSQVVVDVPASGITPTGSLSISSNGTYDVTAFASAIVDIQQPSLSILYAYDVAEQYEKTYTPPDGYVGFSYVVTRMRLSDNAVVKTIASCVSELFDSNGNILSIPEALFSGCSNLTTVSLASCEYISASAFANCVNLLNLNLPNVSFVGGGAFYSCNSLANVELPLCSLISTRAFQKCSALSIVSLPKCETIEMEAFKDCVNLSTVYLMGSSFCALLEYPNLNQYVFSGTPFMQNNSALAKVYVPSSMVSEYLNSFGLEHGWSNYSNCIVGV